MASGGRIGNPVGDTGSTSLLHVQSHNIAITSSLVLGLLTLLPDITSNCPDSRAASPRPGATHPAIVCAPRDDLEISRPRGELILRILIPGFHHHGVRGAHVFIHGLARNLAARGHEVTLQEAATPEHRVRIKDVRMRYVGLRAKRLYPLRFAARPLGRYDVIHSHYLSGAFFALRSRVQRLPFVAEFHVPRVKPDPDANWRWRYVGLTARNAPALLTPTRWLAEALAGAYGVDVRRFNVIPYGVGDSWFEAARQRVATPRTGARVVLVNMKGVDVALKAFAKAASGRAASLDLYGGHRLTNEYEKLAGELRIGNRVRFHGFVPNEHLVDRLLDADVLLHPNSYGNMDQVLLETQALGIPAVASRVGGNAECLAEEETGILCPTGDSDAFAAALMQLLESPERRRRMGDAARSRAEGLFRWSRVAERLEREIYLPLSRGEYPWGIGWSD